MTSRIMREALRRISGASSCAMVAVNCAQATAVFLGAAEAIFCRAAARRAGRVGAGRRGAQAGWKALQSLSALFAPTPGRRRTIRLKASSSRGLRMNFR